MVWISIALVVLGIAFVLRGALLSGSGPIKLPFRSVRLPSARTALVIGGAAAVAVLGTAAINVEGSPTNRATTLADADDEPRRAVTIMAPVAPARTSHGEPASPPAARAPASASADPAPASAPRAPAVASFDNGDDEERQTAGNRRSRAREEEPTAAPTPEADDDDARDDNGSGKGKSDDDGGSPEHD